MITPPNAAQLEAGQALVWALTADPDETGISPTDRAVIEYVRHVNGKQKYDLLQMQPQFLWAFNILDNHGLDALKQAVIRYAPEQDGTSDA